jgi:DNA-binding protein HU-beta
MKKGEMVSYVADAAGLTKADADRAIDAVIAAITKTLKSGDSVTGRNPQTGATIKIKASKNPGFKAGKALKDAVN